MPAKKTTKRVVKKINKDLGILQDISNKCNPDELSYDLDRVEVPTLRRIKEDEKRFESAKKDWENFTKPMCLTDKITWVLTAVNVAILISLVIKNV